MDRKYGLVLKPVVTIYEAKQFSAIADEGLYGTGVCLTGREIEGFVPVRTFYGYTGYVRSSDLQMMSEREIKAWEQSGLMVIDGGYVDIMALPMVSGVRLITLSRGSLIKVLAFESENHGWAKVELIDGRVGYMRNQYLRKKEFSQAGLWTETLPQKHIVDEALFRQNVIAVAKQYLGIQYRWGGRSTAGIDCSGLTSMSYLLNGILIWRDATIAAGYSVHKIPIDQMLPADLLYFPGHIALYLGSGRYIHSTGKIGSGGVVINSLNPEDADYRADLVESLYAVGSVFFEERG